MNMAGLYHDFLGWNYVLWFSGGLVLAWLYLIHLIKKRKKTISKKTNAAFLSVTVILIVHFVFVAVINPYFFGYGSPKKLDKMLFIDNYICLFDTETDLMTPEDDYGDQELNIHTRVHVVDKNSQELLYSEQLGTNYTYQGIQNRIYFIGNSTSPKENDNYIKSIEQFNPKTKERKMIAEQGEEVSVGDKSADVFEIIIENGILINTKKAERFAYDAEKEQFKPVDSVQYFPPNPTVNFRYLEKQNNSDVSSISYKHKDLNQRFILPNYLCEFSISNKDYCLVRAYNDLTKQLEEISVINDQGELMWKKSVINLGDACDVSLDGFDLMLINQENCYLTSGSYLFECDALNGNLNWWIKL